MLIITHIVPGNFGDQVAALVKVRGHLIQSESR